MASRSCAAVVLSLCSSVLFGCGDDNAPPPGEPDTHQPDSTDDLGGSDTDVAEPTPWEREWPPLDYADPLPLSPTFDAAYEGEGSALVSTLRETLMPRYGFDGYLTADGALRVPQEAFGRLAPQPGEPHQLRHQLALPETLEAQVADLAPGSLHEDFRSALYVLSMADPQLVDQDSPVSPATNATFSLGDFTLPAYRHAGEFLPHFFDLAIRTINRFSAQHPFDAVLLSGDLMENAQANELHWVHTILQGGVLSSDSGPRDDIFPGPGNDAFDPFRAEGLHPETPWVAIAGNHDLNLIGNFPPQLMKAIHELPGGYAQLQAPMTPFGLVVPGYPSSDWHPAYFPARERSAFRVNPWNFHPLQFAQQAELLALEPDTIVADSAREPLDLCAWVKAQQALPGLPPGHGFDTAAVEDCRGWFSWDPLGTEHPIRIIGLTLGPLQGGPWGILSRPTQGDVLDGTRAYDPRFDQVAFLDAELERAEREGVGLIIIAHQPSHDMRTQSLLRTLTTFLDEAPDVQGLMEQLIPHPQGALSTQDLRQRLARSGHVLAWLAGHTHTNEIRAICADGSARETGEGACEPGPNGESGYWEMSTSGVLSFPHQLRAVELVTPRDGSELAALYTTMIDLRPSDEGLTWQGLFLALALEQVSSGTWGHKRGTALDRNVLLPLRLPSSVAQRMANSPLNRPIASENALLERLPALPALPEQP